MEEKDKKKSSKPGRAINRTLFARTFAVLVKSKRHFLLFQLLYAVITLFCLVPLISYLAGISMKYSGYSYITTENLVEFLKRPLTLISLIIISFVTGVLLLWEIALVSSFILAGKGLDKRPAVYIFLGSLRNTCNCFRVQNLLSILLAYGVLIASNIIVIIGIVTRTRVPNYIVKSITHIPMMKLVIGIMVFVIVLVVYCNLFTLSYFLLERKSLRESRKNCRNLFRGHRLHSIGSLLLWNAGTIVVSVGAYFLLIIAQAIFVMLFVDKTMAVAVFLSLYERTNFYAGFGLAWFGLYANIAITVELFLQYKKVHEEEFQADDVHVASRVLTDKRKRIVASGILLFVFVIDGLYTKQKVLDGNGIPILSSFDGVKISAHRGYSNKAPENTLPAFQAAIDSFADYAELDVQLTKDGEVIVLHDSNLARTTGVNKFIWNLTFEKVRSLDAGKWFSKEYRGTQIPTLEEVIILCKGKIRMNIEIKSNSRFTDLEEKVVALIHKYDIQKQCVIQSTDYSTLVKVKKLDSTIPTGLILMGAYGEFEESTNVDFFSIRSTFVNKNMVESAHKNGKAVYAWTVNKKNEIRRMKVLKVDNIISDRPVLSREVLYQEEFNISFLNLIKLLKG